LLTWERSDKSGIMALALPGKATASKPKRKLLDQVRDVIHSTMPQLAVEELRQ